MLLHLKSKVKILWKYCFVKQKKKKAHTFFSKEDGISAKKNIFMKLLQFVLAYTLNLRYFKKLYLLVEIQINTF